MVFKYSALILTTAVVVAIATEPQSFNSPASDGEVTWQNVLECFKAPNTVASCLETRMERTVNAWRDTTVRMARSDPDTTPEDVAGVGDIVQQIGDLITYGIARIFPGEDEEQSPSTGDALDAINGVDEGRGHKKKKIQKEIKKFVLKILFGIFLFKQKIKMIIMMIQSILMSKFLIVAMIYALSNTFKIWYDIKKSKHQHHDKVVYYENAHHQHHYEPPEHSEYEDHHGWGGGVWGRSIAVTEPTITGQRSSDDVNRFVRRVTRNNPTQAQDQAQFMAYNGQRQTA
ncbi:uncharacterized protein LOC126898983 [Daktulosphaira vitifoliae]|uniref:uncharacterized protein LOC126898983 n=1 Tax=Daktulosphaira vitifoliae TaxID=58002 RepID=UPI0021AA64CD|nr:uncharacterized protein LOC126898983 [Daktulosphaira vitifoliae]